MKKSDSSLSRRKATALGLMGCATLVLGSLSGCTSQIEQIIPVEVERMPDGDWRVKNIDIPIYKGVKKIRFISGTRGWAFHKQETPEGSVKTGPRLWLDSDTASDIKAIDLEADGTVLTTKIPSGQNKLHVYFVMTSTDPDIVTDGGCGGGGEVYER